MDVHLAERLSFNVDELLLLQIEQIEFLRGKTKERNDRSGTRTGEIKCGNQTLVLLSKGTYIFGLELAGDAVESALMVDANIGQSLVVRRECCVEGGGENRNQSLLLSIV